MSAYRLHQRDLSIQKRRNWMVKHLDLVINWGNRYIIWHLTSIIWSIITYLHHVLIVFMLIIFIVTTNRWLFSMILENPGVVSVDGRETYFIGIIDILQSYNLNKKIERFVKVSLLRRDRVTLHHRHHYHHLINDISSIWQMIIPIMIDHRDCFIILMCSLSWELLCNLLIVIVRDS